MQSLETSGHAQPLWLNNTLVELSIYAAPKLFRGLSVQFIHRAENLNVFIKAMVLITLTDSWRESSEDIFPVGYWCMQSYFSLLKTLQKCMSIFFARL